jgi:hypothetical protein
VQHVLHLFLFITLFYGRAVLAADSASTSTPAPPKLIVRTLELKKDSLPTDLKKDIDSYQAEAKSSSENEEGAIVGAIFLCDPYCEFIDYVYQDTWTVEYNQKQNPEHYRFIGRNSPVFQNYFQADDVEKAEKEQRQKVKKIVEDEPWFFDDYSLGIFYQNDNMSSNTALQSNLGSPYYFGGQAKLSLIPNLWFSPYRFRMYNYMNVDFEQTLNRVSSANSGVNITTTAMHGQYDLLHRSKNFIWGAGVFYHSETNQLSSESLSGYGYTYQVEGLNVNLHWKKWLFDISKALQVNVVEDFSYRAPPANYDWMRLQVKWASPRVKMLKEWASYTLGAEYKTFTQSTASAPNLFLGSLSTNETFFGFFVSLEAGDLWLQQIK